MAQINFEDLMNETSQSNGGGTYDVGFFSLKNDGDTAIVRFAYDNVSQFDLYAVHEVEAGEKRRRINCLRDARSPMSACPLCEAGEKLQQKFYIKLIEYVVDPQTNKVIPKARIWERSARFAINIKNLIDEYGPLTNNVFKIKRNGAKGSTDTTYAIMYSNPQVYNETVYPKAFNLFDNYSIENMLVHNKTAEEMNTYLETGNFPNKSNKTMVDIDSVVDETPQSNTAVYTTTPSNAVYTTTPSNYETISPSIPTNSPSQTTANPSLVIRPTRYY